MIEKQTNSSSENTQDLRKPILVVMTRWPAVNRCKTRLSTQIGPNRAANIQKRLTKHTIAVAKEASKTGAIELVLAVDGIGKQKAFRWAKSEGVKNIQPQGAGNLGIKMKRQLLLAQRKGSFNIKKPRKTIIIGSDLPNLAISDINITLESLNHNQLVLGPSIDGGYWLIGLSDKIIKPDISWPFNGINWGNCTVLKETLRRAKLKGLKYKLLNTKNDIDMISDLIPWQR
ncbi:TIGR04282 family arsenosugar biosynthesis glycosyltransferase [Prochlorococcus marinus]|uniref:TIGR04282 family arsenosugar biosynthesis glycosyltransferase n=1 Tax=Prochlorococcus marinus TaxID=1219 RepID=UPI0022B4859C|nr:TIGR04282 family arsenosugar biosynthesis glycosyltransferase [Prochlorococcus marinus]